MDRRRPANVIDTARRAAANPAKAARRLGHVVRKTATEAAVELQRRAASVDRQRPYIERFVANDAFVLVVLDACRYDAFVRMVDGRLVGRLTKVWAAGRWTADYARRTWTRNDDLTYLSSIPVFSDFYFELRGKPYRPSDHLGTVVPLWDDCWDPALGTVPAEDVTDAALGYLGQTDSPRLVVHYAQPHVPYIGDTRLPRDDEAFYTDATVEEQGVRHLLERDIDRPTQRIHEQLQSGRIADSTLREAYTDNLAYVLEEVTRLLRHLDCPVVITSDHGEHLGERGRYLHEEDSASIRQVPWFEVDEREMHGRAIDDDYEAVASRPATPDLSDEAVRERLADLGYIG